MADHTDMSAARAQVASGIIATVAFLAFAATASHGDDWDGYFCVSESHGDHLAADISRDTYISTEYCKGPNPSNPNSCIVDSMKDCALLCGS